MIFEEKEVQQGKAYVASSQSCPFLSLITFIGDVSGTWIS